MNLRIIPMMVFIIAFLIAFGSFYLIIVTETWSALSDTFKTILILNLMVIASLVLVGYFIDSDNDRLKAIQSQMRDAGISLLNHMDSDNEKKTKEQNLIHGVSIRDLKTEVNLLTEKVKTLEELINTHHKVVNSKEEK